MSAVPKKFKDNTFYSFDDGYGKRAIGWRSHGIWRFIFDDTTDDDLFWDEERGTGFTGISTLDPGSPDDESVLWELNPRKVK